MPNPQGQQLYPPGEGPVSSQVPELGNAEESPDLMTAPIQPGMEAQASGDVWQRMKAARVLEGLRGTYRGEKTPKTTMAAALPLKPLPPQRVTQTKRSYAIPGAIGGGIVGAMLAEPGSRMKGTAKGVVHGGGAGAGAGIGSLIGSLGLPALAQALGVDDAGRMATLEQIGHLGGAAAGGITGYKATQGLWNSVAGSSEKEEQRDERKEAMDPSLSLFAKCALTMEGKQPKPTAAGESGLVDQMPMKPWSEYGEAAWPDPSTQYWRQRRDGKGKTSTKIAGENTFWCKPCKKPRSKCDCGKQAGLVMDKEAFGLGDITKTFFGEGVGGMLNSAAQTGWKGIKSVGDWLSGAPSPSKAQPQGVMGKIKTTAQDAMAGKPTMVGAAQNIAQHPAQFGHDAMDVAGSVMQNGTHSPSSMWKMYQMSRNWGQPQQSSWAQQVPGVVQQAMGKANAANLITSYQKQALAPDLLPAGVNLSSLTDAPDVQAPLRKNPMLLASGETMGQMQAGGRASQKSFATVPTPTPVAMDQAATQQAGQQQMEAEASDQLSDFAQGFIKCCAERGLDDDQIVEAMLKAAELDPIVAEDLGMTKQAGNWRLEAGKGLLTAGKWLGNKLFRPAAKALAGTEAPAVAKAVGGGNYGQAAKSMAKGVFDLGGKAPEALGLKARMAGGFGAGFSGDTLDPTSDHSLWSAAKRGLVGSVIGATGGRYLDPRVMSQISSTGLRTMSGQLGGAAADSALDLAGYDTGGRLQDIGGTLGFGSSIPGVRRLANKAVSGVTSPIAKHLDDVAGRRPLAAGGKAAPGGQQMLPGFSEQPGWAARGLAGTADKIRGIPKAMGGMVDDVTNLGWKGNTAALGTLMGVEGIQKYTRSMADNLGIASVDPQTGQAVPFPRLAAQIHAKASKVPAVMAKLDGAATTFSNKMGIDTTKMRDPRTGKFTIEGLGQFADAAATKAEQMGSGLPDWLTGMWGNLPPIAKMMVIGSIIPMILGPLTGNTGMGMGAGLGLLAGGLLGPQLMPGMFGGQPQQAPQQAPPQAEPSPVDIAAPQAEALPQQRDTTVAPAAL